MRSGHSSRRARVWKYGLRNMRESVGLPVGPRHAPELCSTALLLRPRRATPETTKRSSSTSECMNIARYPRAAYRAHATPKRIGRMYKRTLNIKQIRCVVVVGLLTHSERGLLILNNAWRLSNTSTFSKHSGVGRVLQLFSALSFASSRYARFSLPTILA